MLCHNVHEVLPFIYTPTVGEACQRYFELPLQTWGLYIGLDDRGSILQKLRSWPKQDIRVSVVTDGERILGLGDLGAGGMGISEGKIMLYTVAAGIDPFKCLPICLDVGTNNEDLLHSESYKGRREKRVTGPEYDDFVDEFVCALREWQPHLLLQWEDFGNHNAFRLLEKYQDSFPCFNDDIQGTACIVLAGVLSAIRATDTPLEEQRFVFMGAGEAGIGIGELIATEVAVRTGKAIEEARKSCLFIDSKGLVCASRDDLKEHKKPFAHEFEYEPDLLSTVQQHRPTAIIGVSTIARSFTKEVIEEMSRINKRPIIFPLSNPTDLSECTFEEAMTWSGGRALFASGSPFDPFEYEGKTYYPAQANNAYVFPALGHAAVLTRAQCVPTKAFLRCAEALSHVTSLEQVNQGMLFPSFDDILRVTKTVMLRLCEFFESESLGQRPTGQTWEELIDESMWGEAKKSRL